MTYPTSSVVAALAAAAAANAKVANPPPPVRNTYLSIQGTGFKSGYNQSFDVLCGSNPPTITDGYAQWSVIPRPLQRGLTVFTGYNPVQMTVDVIFGSFNESYLQGAAAGGWQTSDATGAIIEKDIRKLAWMAGSNFVAGPSPVVYVFSWSTQGGATDLVPPEVRGIPWIISTGGLTWGQAWRTPNGFRIYQEATITLQNYLNIKAPPAPDVTMSGGYFTTSLRYNQPITIAAAPSANSPIADTKILAKAICTSGKNNPIKGTNIRLGRKSLYYRIRVSPPCKVWIPSHIVS